MHIAFIADEAYAPALAVAVRSVLLHSLMPQVGWQAVCDTQQCCEQFPQCGSFSKRTQAEKQGGWLWSNTALHPLNALSSTDCC